MPVDHILSRLRNMLRKRKRDTGNLDETMPQAVEAYVPRPEDYPTFPPASPEHILEDAPRYSAAVHARKYGAPQGVFEDNSLFALYRLYEFIVLDERFAYRNNIEWFWRKHQWLVKDIPDHKDDNPSRYAFLAGVTYLLVRSFNERIQNGLRRRNSPLISMEEIESARAQPESEQPYEQVPPWAEKVPPLGTALVIPTDEGVRLESKDNERADPDFASKNILLWTPHIFFT